MNPWLILGAVAAIGAAGVGGYYKGSAAGMAEVQQAWDKEKTEQYAQYAKAMEESIEAQQMLQMGADRLRQEKDREIRDIAARNTALTNSLRDRKARPAEGSSMSNASGAGSGGCTGKNLYREDGEFLVRLSREADELAVALKQCYAQYESVRQTVK
jgi:hypothetical protein